MHVAGVDRRPGDVRAHRPRVVGNRREMLISELSGKGTVQARAREAGIELDDAAAAAMVERVKELEHRGYHYEAADGSFELLLRKETGDYEPLFPLESWRAIVEKRADGRVETEATIKIWVDGERYVPHRRGQRSGQRAGPRAARGAGARSTLTCATSSWSTSRSGSSTRPRAPGAVTRVLLDASDGDRVWGSIGVSENVIEASWEALVDSLEYGMQLGRRDARCGGAAGDRGSGRVIEPSPVDDVPLAQPVLGRAGGGARAGRAALRPAVARPGAGASSSGPSPPGWASRTPARCPAARRACTWRCAPPGSATATRS